MTTNKEELVNFFKQMYMMRRVEITNDTEYKVYQKTLIYDILLLCFISHLFATRHVLFVGFAICTMVKKPLLPVCISVGYSWLLVPGVKVIDERLT